MKDTTLKQLVRDRKGQPRGMVIATIVDNRIALGWSFTNTKAGDRFNKQKAFLIATGRVDNGWGDKVTVPHLVRKSLNHMAVRATRYFKSHSF